MIDNSIDKNKFMKVNPEYVYMTIPADYICTYHKILIMFTEYGIDMLKDCSAGCANHNKKVIDCFNMFNAAVAARKLGQEKLAETLIKYINAQIKAIYRNDIPCPDITYPITEDGRIRATVSCGDDAEFYVDEKTGMLISESKEINGTIYGLSEIDN